MAAGQTVADMLSAPVPVAANDPAPPPGFAAEATAPPSPPPGFSPVQTPAPVSAAGHFGMGVRGVLGGLAAGVDTVAGAPAALANLVTGSHLPTTPVQDLATKASDALNLPKPVTNTDKLIDAVDRGGAAGLVTVAGGAPLAPVKGIVGSVGEMLAQTPVKMAASSAISAGAGEEAAQHGAGPVGQTVASLAGGIGGYAGLAGLEGAAARLGIPPKAAAIAQATPKDVMIDGGGNLTDEGIHASVQNEVAPAEIQKAYSVTPEQIKTAYESGDGAFVRPPEEPVLGITPEAAVVEAPAPPAADAPAAPEATPQPVGESGEPQPAVAQPITDAQPATATARLTEASDLGVALTRGQALQDPVIQRTEQEFQATSPVAQSKADAFRTAQQAAIQENVDQIKSAFGDPNLTAQDRGDALKAGIRDLQKQGAAGVTAKYNALADVLGPDTPIDPSGILDAADDVIINKPTDPGVIRSIETALAKFGLTPGEQIPAGRRTIIQPEHGAPITVMGDVTPLTLGNAEDFRKALNAAYRADHNGFTGNIIKALDASTDETVQQAVKSGDPLASQKLAASKDARQAAKEQKANFGAKDIVQNLADVKSGTSTDFVSAERGIRQVLGSGPDDVTNLKRVKAVLLSKPTEASKAAWKAVQAQGLADIFRSAETPQGISGAKLTSAINRFGRQKLKVLLDPADFDGLMKVERVTRNATIPLPGTVNHSGSGYVMMRFLGQQGAKLASVARVVPIVGPIAEAGAHILKTGFQGAEAERGIKAMLEFGPKDAARADARVARGQTPTASPADYYHDLIDVTGNGAVLRGALSALSSEQQEAVN